MSDTEKQAFKHVITKGYGYKVVRRIDTKTGIRFQSSIFHSKPLRRKRWLDEKDYRPTSRKGWKRNTITIDGGTTYKKGWHIWLNRKHARRSAMLKTIVKVKFRDVADIGYQDFHGSQACVIAKEILII
jgi:hypothetical protein